MIETRKSMAMVCRQTPILSRLLFFYLLSCLLNRNTTSVTLPMTLDLKIPNVLN
ncbi:hypothetical protein SCOR_01945 [Sulfidibacter corallicola]